MSLLWKKSTVEPKKRPAKAKALLQHIDGPSVCPHYSGKTRPGRPGLLFHPAQRGSPSTNNRERTFWEESPPHRLYVTARFENGKRFSFALTTPKQSTKQEKSWPHRMGEEKGTRQICPVKSPSTGGLLTKEEDAETNCKIPRPLKQPSAGKKQGRGAGKV